MAHHDPRVAHDARHRADRRRHADLLRPARLARAVPPARASLRRADPPHAQLLGRADLARHLGLPVRLPADPLLRHRHRPGARARRGDARRGPVGAVPAHLLPAAAAGTGNVLLPCLRAGVLRVSIGSAGRGAGRADARHLHRGVRGGVRALRLLARLRRGDDHGLRAARDRRGGARRALAPLPRAGYGRQRMSLAVRAWRALLAGLITLFVLNIGLMIAAVITHSFARRWLGTWLPDGYTTGWYVSAWKEFQLDAVLWVTVEVVGAVVVLSIVLGVPAAYALARRDFIGKRALLLLFLLPLLVPPITYGIPLATVMYQLHLAGTLPGVILANLVPALPFVVLVMTPFIEQIDPNLESAARVLGADTPRMFLHVLVPLLAPGILAASLLDLRLGLHPVLRLVARLEAARLGFVVGRFGDQPLDFVRRNLRLRRGFGGLRRRLRIGGLRRRLARGGAALFGGCHGRLRL